MLNHFNFKKYGDEILITNDFGRYLFLTYEEFRRFLKQNFEMADDLGTKLHKNLFVVEPVDFYSYETATDLRAMKQYTFSSTSLHIFVLTTACNLRCIYCQAQEDHSKLAGVMSAEVARAAVDIALQSPANNLTFEFQGGEPLFNFPVMKEIIEYTNTRKGSKSIEFTLVSNLSLLTEEI